MFTAENLQEVVRLFREADVDGGGGLDIEEFSEAMKELFPTTDEEDLVALHMKIDTNGDGSVDLGELTDYLVNKNKSRGHMEFFTCVEYSPASGYLLTGGTDALLRVWFPHKTLSCIQELKGHVKPITHLMLNPREKVFVSLSQDHNVRVWSEAAMICLQSFKIKEMMQSPISSVCYNTYNNELVLANTDIGKYLGRGTDVGCTPAEV
uniref:WD repeat-containing protein on Y chromosome n=1 Tax=Sander lucioperca TaxID=283035 RepID=A0A8C9XBC1_SANLU